MYTGYLLTDQTRSKLLAQFPPKYERVVGHHITEKFGVGPEVPAPDMPSSVMVVGYIDSGDGVEGLLVAVNGSTNRKDGSKYHITWSLANGRKPVETNNYVNDAVDVEPIAIAVEPKNFGTKLAALKGAVAK